MGVLLASAFAACGGSDTAAVSGALSVNNGEALQIAPNVAYSVPVSLRPSAAVATLPVIFAVLPVAVAVAAEPVAATAVPVAITSSDPTVASVYPSTCHLSSDPGQDTCHVTVRGLTTGVVSLLATAPGYAPAAAPAAIRVAATPNYGRIQIGAFPSASAPSTSNFAMTAQQNDTVTLAASITNFDTSLDGVPILLTITSGGGSIVGNPQCNVDSAADANHYCLYKIKLPAAPATVVVSAKAVGSVAGDFSNQPTASITVQASAVPGTLVLQSTDGVVPLGMSSPFWAVLQDSSGVGDTVVTVSGSANVTINPAVSAASGAYQARSCTLSSSSPVCGFGIKGDALGTASVSATAASGGYTIKTLNLSVNPQLGTSRTITFQNNDSAAVWVGITGGTATSYVTRDMVTTVNPQTNGANVTCGPSNASGACPTGSTCRQGGASPAAATAYFCYWDQPVPTNGYQLASTGTKQTSISISDSSYDRIADITWSGNAYPRQGCAMAGSQLVCDIADCGNSTSGSACAPGTGGAPGIATLVEFTLQRHNTDYYDVSIIGGANVATTFGPTPAVSSSTPCFCATAGATTTQVQGATTLLASDWNMAAHVQAVFSGSTPYSITGQTAGAQSTAYYHYIATPAGGRTGVGCATGSACTGGLVCGYDKNAVNNGSNSDYQTSCGTHLVWLSANAIGALNTAATNSAPFSFNTQIYNTTAAGAVKTASLYLCNASTNQSGYNSEDASTACGCTNWGNPAYSIAGDAVFPSQFATPTDACVTNNNAGGTYYWTRYVLPTIAWMKQSCPTCYTYPFDDKSSTFQCVSTARPNSINYLVQFNGTIPGQ